MNTLLLANHIRGFKIEGPDGVGAKVRDFYFDDATWSIKYIVAETNDWLGSKRLLLQPEMLKTPDWRARKIRTGLTTEEIKQSPSVDTHVPVAVALQQQIDSLTSWNVAWPESFMGLNASVGAEYRATGDEPHLRSTSILSGVMVKSGDGRELGAVRDFVLDANSWRIPYLLLETSQDGLMLMDSSEAESIDVSRRMMVLKDPESALGNFSVAYDPRYTVIVDSGNKASRPESAHAAI